MSVLSDYKVQLVKRENFGKQVFTINDDLTICLNNFNSLAKANELLNLINEVINNNDLEIEYPTRSLGLLILKSPDIAIYETIESWELNNTIPPDYSLPIVHFKAIAEAWRNYL
jgi:hypothetical protein